MSHQFFLSYSRKDTQLMIQLRTLLVAEGLSVWTDSGIAVGTPEWDEAIETALRDTECVIALFSPDFKESPYCKSELTIAKYVNKPIFPILVRGDDFTSTPFGLNQMQRADGRTDLQKAFHDTITAACERLGVMSATMMRLEVEAAERQRQAAEEKRLRELEAAENRFLRDEEARQLKEFKEAEKARLRAEESEIRKLQAGQEAQRQIERERLMRDAGDQVKQVFGSALSGAADRLGSLRPTSQSQDAEEIEHRRRVEKLRRETEELERRREAENQRLIHDQAEAIRQAQKGEQAQAKLRAQEAENARLRAQETELVALPQIMWNLNRVVVRATRQWRC